MWKVDSNFIVRTYFYKLSNPSHLNYRISLVNYLIILSYRLFLDIFHNELYKFHSIRSISEAIPLISSFYVSFYRDLIFDISSRAYHFIYSFHAIARFFFCSSRFRIPPPPPPPPSPTSDSISPV